MTGEEFKKEISTAPKNIYCLVSSDAGIIDLYVKRFKDAIQADSVVYGQIQATGKLLKKKTLCVLYEPKLNEELFNYTSYILVHTDSIDKRSALYKKYKDRFIEVSNDYTSFIMSHTNLNEQGAKTFAKYCNNDLGIIKNSIEIYNAGGKIANYSSDIYQWVENFLMRKKLPQVTESPISVLGLLSVNCQNLMNIKLGKTAGMNPYIVSCMDKFKSYRTVEDLASIISDCFYLDCQVKKGLMDVNDILKYLVAKERSKVDAITN